MNMVDYILKYIGKDKIEEIDLYIMEAISGSFRVFKSEQDIKENLDGYLEKFLEKLNYEEKEKIKSYTGLSFRRINSVLRNSWNYEINGKLTSKIKKDSEEQAKAIRNILLKSESLPLSMCVYRGVSLSSFYKYGISRIEDLPQLTNRFVYQEGFTSTSLLRDTSFFHKPTEWGEKANIEIEYLIPREADDGALINCSLLSLSPEQNEYLINSGSLFKVISVEVSDDKKTAKMQIALVPQKVWDPYDYEMERQLTLSK